MYEKTRAQLVQTFQNQRTQERTKTPVVSWRGLGLGLTQCCKGSLLSDNFTVPPCPHPARLIWHYIRFLGVCAQQLTQKKQYPLVTIETKSPVSIIHDYFLGLLPTSVLQDGCISTDFYLLQTPCKGPDCIIDHKYMLMYMCIFHNSKMQLYFWVYSVWEHHM